MLISGDISKPSEPIAYQIRFFSQFDDVCKQMNVKLMTTQALYKDNFNRNVQCTPKLYFRKHIFADRLAEQAIKPARMENAPLRKLMPKMLNLVEVLSTTSNTVTVDEDAI